MKNFRKTNNCKILLASAALALSLGAQDAMSAGAQPKYVFFFLGDGMASGPQIRQQQPQPSKRCFQWVERQ